MPDIRGFGYVLFSPVCSPSSSASAVSPSTHGSISPIRYVLRVAGRRGPRREQRNGSRRHRGDVPRREFHPTRPRRAFPVTRNDGRHCVRREGPLVCSVWPPGRATRSARRRGRDGAQITVDGTGGHNQEFAPHGRRNSRASVSHWSASARTARRRVRRRQRHRRCQGGQRAP